MKSIVVAYDQQRGIGAENDLLWKRDLKADLAHFKQLTIGTSMVMGRKTFESIGRALPGRQTIVVSRQMSHQPGVTVVGSLKDAYMAATYEDITIVGGGQVYEQTINEVDRIYATEVDAIFPQADIFFPEIRASDWMEISRESHVENERNIYNFDFVTYEPIVK